MEQIAQIELAVSGLFTSTDETSMIDFLEMPAFLEPATLQELRDGVRQTQGIPATLLSKLAYGTVDSRVRRSMLLQVEPQIRDRLIARVLEAKEVLEAHFDQPLGEHEEPQFLRYEVGDFFVAHQDGNTPLIYDRSRFRRVTVILFLSNPAEYSGGTLVLHGSGNDYSSRVPIRPAAGTLVAFRAETTHEVTPVAEGERYTAVFFFCAPEECA